MQRLTRNSRDRGAVAVWVAILLVPLMVVAALALDVGAAHADRQRLQTGADAAALAIANDCALNACGDDATTAQILAGKNDPLGGSATGIVTELDTSTGWVEVQTTSENEYWFAPVIGIDQVGLSATGAASWGAPGSGRPAIPFAFAACELAGFGILQLDAGGDPIGLQASTVGTRYLLEQSKVTNATSCPAKPTSGNWAPGGFGWLLPDGLDPDAPCSVETAIGDTVESANGNSQGDPTGPCYQALKDAIDDGNRDGSYAALLPVFRSNTAASINEPKEYLITGYLAVTLEGFRFNGNDRCHGETISGGTACGAPAVGNGGWIVVTVQRYIASNEDFETSPAAPDLGSAVVSLELPREG